MAEFNLNDVGQGHCESNFLANALGTNLKGMSSEKNKRESFITNGSSSKKTKINSINLKDIVEQTKNNIEKTLSSVREAHYTKLPLSQ